MRGVTIFAGFTSTWPRGWFGAGSGSFSRSLAMRTCPCSGLAAFFAGLGLNTSFLSALRFAFGRLGTGRGFKPTQAGI